eukprot:8713956-Karenia_brevis.AAC.1
MKTVMLEPSILALLFPLRQGGGKKDRDDEVDRLRKEVKRLRSSGSKGSGGSRSASKRKRQKEGEQANSAYAKRVDWHGQPNQRREPVLC